METLVTSQRLKFTLQPLDTMDRIDPRGNQYGGSDNPGSNLIGAFYFLCDLG